MNFSVVNHELKVCSIRAGAVASSSILLVGDAYCITLNSMFDTPPESLIITPAVPLSLR